MLKQWMLGFFAVLLPCVGTPTVGEARELFNSADRCMACHNGLYTPTGEDISIGFNWRPSMMANAARDPYWHAAVRRESIDYPMVQASIEGECSICHMPMASLSAKALGQRGTVFSHLPIGKQDTPADRFAADGVSCTTCHQVENQKLGTRESFTGGLVIDTTRSWGQRRIYGPYHIDPGRTRIMRSASEFVPSQATHLKQSEVCATCHTLYTHARGPKGEVIGEFPEQVPYLEWQHSSYRTKKSCQNCHLPTLKNHVSITSVWGQPRSDFSSHSFNGGNFFIPRLFNRYRDQLGVDALSTELDLARQKTVAHLQSSTASVAIERAEIQDEKLAIEVKVTNWAGHKLPTAYPSRRAWLHLTVRGNDGTTLFESGAPLPNGSIRGNDNDQDLRRYEPHYTKIERPDQVQIYESILGDRNGQVTTGLLSAVRYLKDNRLLPRGFDKASAPKDIAVQGDALQDADFTAGGDRVQYLVPLRSYFSPLTIEVRLWYQPIAYSWAQNLRPYNASEPKKFLRYYDSMRTATAQLLTRAMVKLHGPTKEL